MKKLFTVLAIIAVFGTQMTPVFAATVARSSQTTSVTQTEETESLETEAEDVVVEEEGEVVEPEIETEDVVVEEESTVVEPEVETEDVVVEDTPMLYGGGETGRTPYEKTPVETTDVLIQTFGVEQVNEFALGQVSSYVDPSVVADKQAAIAELEALTPQSPQPYEVAVVNEANEYFFIEGQPTYEAAIALAQTTELFEGEEAVVINENGMVTYSNSNVARVFKTINGSLYTKCDINTDLYRDASLGTAVGYINQCHTDDVSVLAIQGDAAKIMVAGKVAWLRISTDLLFVSTNQVVNPSYYANENGHFVHYISKNLTTSGGTKLELGPKNDKLQDNVKYYSYDGNYFYTNPETIGPDMNDGVANSAINANDPYYNYFQNLPFNSKAVATAAQIDAYINANTQATSKLRNTGQSFIDAQNKYGINALLMLGIAINESNWGMSSIAQSKNNLFGLNAVDATPGESADYFPTVAACIDLYASDWLAQGYADPQDWRYYGGMLGNKSMGANVKYASDAYWSEKAVAHMYTVDRGINGGTSKEWNYYSIGWFTAPNSVKSSNGQVIYPITAPDSNGVLSLYSSYTNTPIILKETDTSDGKYEVWPERNNTLSSSNNVPASLPYNWNGGEYISTSGVEVITTGFSESTKPTGISTEFKSAKVTGSTMELVSHASYANWVEAPISVIKGQLVSTDGSSTIDLAVSKVSQYDHKFSVDTGKLVTGKTYRLMITVDGKTEQSWNGSKKLPEVMTVTGKAITPTLEGTRIALKVTAVDKGISTEFKSAKVTGSTMELVSHASYANWVEAPISVIKGQLVSTDGSSTIDLAVSKVSQYDHKFSVDTGKLVTGKTYRLMITVDGKTEQSWNGSKKLPEVMTVTGKAITPTLEGTRIALKVTAVDKGISTEFKSAKVTGSTMELVSHASYANWVEAPISVIKGQLVSTDGSSTIDLAVSKVSQYDHKFSVDTGKLVTGKTYRLMITVDGKTEQSWNGSKKLPEVMTVTGKAITPTLEGTRIALKVTAVDKGISTEFKSAKVTGSTMELVSHASYANWVEAPISVIKGQLVSTDGSSTIDLAVSKVSQYDHKFSVDTGKLVTGKTYRLMITVDGKTEQSWNGSKKLPEVMTVTGKAITPTLEGTRIALKVTAVDKGISTEFKSAKATGSTMELVSHASYANWVEAPISVIKGQLVSTDGSSTIDLAVSKVSQYDHKFSVDTGKLVTGKTYRLMITVDGKTEQSWNGSKKLPEVMTVTGKAITPTLEGTRIALKVTAVDKGISTEFKSAKVTGSTMELVSHASYANWVEAPISVIKGQLVSTDGSSTIDLAVSKVSQYDHKFSVDTGKLVTGKTYRLMITVDGKTEQSWNGSKKLPEVMTVTGKAITPTLEGTRIALKVMAVEIPTGISTEFKNISVEENELEIVSHISYRNSISANEDAISVYLIGEDQKKYDGIINSIDNLIKTASFDLSQLPNQEYKVYAKVNDTEEQVWMYNTKPYNSYQSSTYKLTIPVNSRLIFEKSEVSENKNTVDVVSVHGEDLGIETKWTDAESFVLINQGMIVHTKSLALKNNVKKLNNANQGIDLSKLSDGIYQIAVKDNSGVIHNLISSQEKNTKYTAYTVRRNNQLKEVVVDASKGKYPTLTVTTKAANSTNVADVMLDPGHGGDYNPGVADSGACSPLGISCEHTEMLNLMKMVKQGLESHGLKVSMTREVNHSGGQLPLYGKNSRTDKVYQSGAKVTIASHYNSAGTSNRGAFAMHAMQDTNDLSNRIISNLSTMANQPKDLNQHTACEVTKKTGDGTSYGYDYASPTSDCYYMVREYGGNITNGHNKDASGNLYKDNYRTAEPVLVEYFNGANSADVNNYKNNKSKYADAVVKAIVEYFGISYKKTLISEPIELYSLDTYSYEEIDNLK